MSTKQDTSAEPRTSRRRGGCCQRKHHLLRPHISIKLPTTDHNICRSPSATVPLCARVLSVCDASEHFCSFCWKERCEGPDGVFGYGAFPTSSPSSSSRRPAWFNGCAVDLGCDVVDSVPSTSCVLSVGRAAVQGSLHSLSLPRVSSRPLASTSRVSAEGVCVCVCVCV